MELTSDSSADREREFAVQPSRPASAAMLSSEQGRTALQAFMLWPTWGLVDPD